MVDRAREHQRVLESEESVGRRTLALLVAIVLCVLATFFWGVPRIVADVITKVAVFGYLLVLFIFQVRAKRRTAAIDMALIALILAI